MRRRREMIVKVVKGVGEGQSNLATTIGETFVKS